MFEEPCLEAKRMCTSNPEYQAAFQIFDTDRSGTIDICELGNACQAVKKSVENSTMKAMTCYELPFHVNTIWMLAARFAASGGGVIQFPQFAEMMQWLESVKSVFQQIDTDRSGDMSVAELSRALSFSGFNVTGFPGGGDSISLAVAEKIGRAYDADGNGVLTFDEFVQLRLEWDVYMDVWGANVPPGMNAIPAQQLLSVFEAVKESLEPVAAFAAQPFMTGLAGFNAANCCNGLIYNSMFSVRRPFLIRTLELLIVKFGAGSQMITFEQFCMVMEFVKEQKGKFSAADLDKSGAIDLNELANAFAASGLPMAPENLIAIGRRYDADGSGTLEFDEFLQLMIELCP